MFGAYIHAKPDGSVFYVGKGTIARSKNMKRNAWHNSIVNKYGKENIIVKFAKCDSEESAFELEKFIIEVLRDCGTKLTNMTNGGEGTSGFSCSQEHRSKISSAMCGRLLSLEHREKISKSMRRIEGAVERGNRISSSLRNRYKTNEVFENGFASWVSNAKKNSH